MNELRKLWAMSFKIIAFDGGGVKGLVSALLLQKLETRISLIKQTDMFVGTSTGSFLALGLAQDVTLNEIIALYRDKGAEIFNPTNLDGDSVNPFSVEEQAALSLAEQYNGAVDLESIKSIFQSKYRSENLKVELGKLFGAGRLCELPQSGPQVMVNSLQLCSESEGQWAPVSLGSGRRDPFCTMYLADAAMCSGAALTYFPPHKPDEPAGENWGYFADGGLYANYPSASAITYATEHFQADLSEIRMLSIGTGNDHTGIPPQDIGRADGWGAWQWLRPAPQHSGTVLAAPLINAALSASAAACGQYAKQMIGDRFVRANVVLDTPFAFDDWQNLPILEKAVDRFVQTEFWDILVDRVAHYWEAEDDLAIPAMAALSTFNKSWFSTLFKG